MESNLNISNPTTWKVATPGALFEITTSTVDEARELAQQGYEKIAGKRGYTTSWDLRSDGSHVYSIFDTKGRKVTGACMVPLISGN